MTWWGIVKSISLEIQSSFQTNFTWNKGKVNSKKKLLQALPELVHKIRAIATR